MDGRSVLIVEDEEAVRDVAEKIITDNGYRVLTAGSGEEAVELYANEGGSIGLVLLDMGLPGMDGLETMARIRGADPDAKVIVFSGSVELDEDAVLGKGALRLLYKPYRMSELLKCVREFCGEA